MLGGWQISGAAFMRTGTPFTITRTDDRAGTGDGSIGQPIDMNGDPNEGTNGKFSGGVTGGVAADDNFYFNPERLLAGSGRREQVREHAPQRGLWARRSAVGLAIFKNVSLAGTHKMQIRVEMFNFINHPNLSGPNTDPTNANFGRIITKSGDRRDIQLALRYMF